MSTKLFTFASVIEGFGEVDAVPLLIRRICNQLLESYTVKTVPPIRIPRSKIIRQGELERAVRLAKINNSGGPVLVLFDADGDCPAELGPRLKSWARAITRSDDVSIVIAMHEFEVWLLAAAHSLSGK